MIFENSIANEAKQGKDGPDYGSADFLGSFVITLIRLHKIAKYFIFS